LFIKATAKVAINYELAISLLLFFFFFHINEWLFHWKGLQNMAELKAILLQKQFPMPTCKGNLLNQPKSINHAWKVFYHYIIMIIYDFKLK
jgi:hypothetical protein